MTECVCGSHRAFDECCGPYLNGTKQAPTAEALMRSRYAAYAHGNIDYIEKTCCAEERAAFNREEAQQVIDEMTWQGLEIIRVVDGGEKDQTGQVEFVFCFSQGDKPFVQRELATFCREDGAWVYKESEINPKTEPHRAEKIGRNDPCSCGSGKKYKKCCGA